MKNKLLNEWKSQIKQSEIDAYKSLYLTLFNRHGARRVMAKHRLIEHVLERAKEGK